MTPGDLRGLNFRQLRKVCNVDAVADVGNLFDAAHKARIDKARRPDVEEWWLRRETEILALHRELLSGAYQPGPYRLFEVHEPKRRLIAAAPFRDRVVHHALCNLLQPVLERRFIARTFSCQIGKGTTAARECCREMTNRRMFVLKCDVSKFFQQIDHAILLERLWEWVGCERARELIRRIVASYTTPEELPRNILPGEDWTEVVLRPRGVPIGNLTSQLWGNFYLDELDHVVTERRRHGDYVRYTDDMLFFDNDKDKLWELEGVVKTELAKIRLRLSYPKSRMLATREGVPFCGFRFLPGLRPRILGATKRRFEARRHAMFCRRAPWSAIGRSVFSWYQFSKEGNTEGLRKAYMRWPFDPRLRRRHGRTRPGLAGRGLEQQRIQESAVVEPQQQRSRES